MTTKFWKLISTFLLFVSLLNLTSCKKDKFDEPPHVTTDPNLTTVPISQLRALYSSGLPIVISDDIIVQGVVTADDASGNFYKMIVIQDTSGAIPILIERSALDADYPIGRKIYVKCKGLVLGAYNKYVQLGGFIDNSTGQPAVGNIPSVLVNNVIVKGPMVTPLEPRVISSFSELSPTADQSILVKLEPVHFKATEFGKPFADIVNQQSLSRKLLDCDSASIDVRTSNYAKFSNELVPSGQLSVIGIFSVYGSTKQLTLRNTTEITSTTATCPTILLNQDFEQASPLTGWINFKQEGNRDWYVTTFSGNKLLKASAYSTTSPDASNIIWLITPGISLDATTNEKLTFISTQGQVAGTTSLELFISTDYPGSGDPTGATWTPLSFTYPALPTTGSFGADTPSGVISLNSYSGTAYIAFRYTGSGTLGNTTTYELDNIKITGQ